MRPRPTGRHQDATHAEQASVRRRLPPHSNQRVSTMRPKPKNASEHHGAFGRMRLRYEGEWMRNNGARFHRFEMGCHHGYRWHDTAADKIQRHLGEAGYETVESADKNDGTGTPSWRLSIYRRGSDEIRVFSNLTRDGRERVIHVDHYPDGTAGDDRRPRITISDVISAMSWGCA